MAEWLKRRFRLPMLDDKQVTSKKMPLSESYQIYNIDDFTEVNMKLSELDFAEGCNIMFNPSCSPKSTNNFNSNTVEPPPMNEHDRNFSEESRDAKKSKRRSFSLDISSKNDNVLSEFAELSTNEELLQLQKHLGRKSRTPLSGLKLVNFPDGSSPYLYCSRYFSQSSPSALIPYLDREQLNQNADFGLTRNKMSSLIDDSSVWPFVWTTFGRASTVQYTKDDYIGPVLSLENLTTVDKDIHLQEFQRYWNFQSKFLVVEKTLLSSTTAKIKICSCLYADRHASHLIVTVPTHHPFFVENRGWCQVESRSFFFKTLFKLDVIVSFEENDFFKFEEKKTNQRSKEKTTPLLHRGFPAKLNTPPPQVVKPQTPKTELSQVKVQMKQPTPDQLPPKSLPEVTSQVGHPFMYGKPFPHYMDMSRHYPYMTMPTFYPPMPSQMVGQKFESHKQMNLVQLPQNENLKRPMNGFMIFAREMRLQLIRENPGKDNRVISKLLGERWRELSPEDKKRYSDQAKKLSEQRLKVNPMCWKRKKNSNKNKQTFQTTENREEEKIKSNNQRKDSESAAKHLTKEKKKNP